MKQKLNMTMLTDFYELTMGNGYFESGKADEIVYFDMFFRRVPDGGGFAIMAGLESVIEYIKDLEFTSEDIAYLKGKKVFSDGFLEYLKNFKFECDVWAIPEGTPIFPNEPVLTVRGPVIQAQFVETMILLCINHQSLIATKSNRIVRAAEGRGIMEFGTRRAHGESAAIYGARSAYIAGCVVTACTIAERDYDIKAKGTMAHSWVQMFDSELEAFEAYARIYPENCTLLVDTYNVLKEGVPNAIEAFKKLKPHNMAIRIDSGDITYLTKKARVMLDEAGLTQCKIIVSNALDEYIIREVIREGAPIDSFGVGENLITSKSESVFGGVYKLVAVEKNGEIVPKIKISENVEKITTPGFKEVYRLYDKDTNKVIADVITLAGETIEEKDGYEIFDPIAPWKKKNICNFKVRKLNVPIFQKGVCVYKCPSIHDIKRYCSEQIDTLWEEMLRFENPQTYYVDLSHSLWDLKTKLL